MTATVTMKPVRLLVVVVALAHSLRFFVVLYFHECKISGRLSCTHEHRTHILTRIHCTYFIMHIY